MSLLLSGSINKEPIPPVVVVFVKTIGAVNPASVAEFAVKVCINPESYVLL